MTTYNAIPYWKLRRFAARVLAILERHADREPALGASRHTVGVTARYWRDLYDASRAQDGTRAIQLLIGKEAVAKLRRKLRGWVNLLAPRIETLDPSEFGDRPEVPEDVISDAQQLLIRIGEWEQTQAEPLPFSAELKADLEAAIVEAQTQVDEAGNRSANRSARTLQLQEAATAFNRDLIAFRRILAAHLGTSHADYQRLRVARVRTPDVADDDVEAEREEADIADEAAIDAESAAQ